MEPDEAAAIKSDMLLDAIVDMQKIFIIVIKLVRPGPQDVTIIPYADQQNAAVAMRAASTLVIIPPDPTSESDPPAIATICGVISATSLMSSAPFRVGLAV